MADWRRALVARRALLAPTAMAGGREPRPALRAARRALRRAGWTSRALVLARKGELVAAERAHMRGLRATRDEYQAADTVRLNALKQGKARIETLRAGRRVASWGQLTLFDNRIELPRATVELSTEVHAMVGHAPALALARPAAIARLASGKDERRLLRDVARASDESVYLMVEAGSEVALVCADRADAAREFAARVNVAALNAERVKRERRAAVLEAERELLRVDREHEQVVLDLLRRYQERRDETRAVDRARRELEAALEGRDEIGRLRESLVQLAGERGLPHG